MSGTITESVLIKVQAALRDANIAQRQSGMRLTDKNYELALRQVCPYGTDEPYPRRVFLEWCAKL